MSEIRKITDPDTIQAVSLNFETSRDALQILEYNLRAMDEDETILAPTILELILYEFLLSDLPETVTEEIRTRVPEILIETVL
ncbi:MAG: hypothetical protein D4R97_04020 [Bacteroidetes bacterium]|nr:MAG: hypothetical protein D4R97_04020 [Bacteroidota bacterium]